jgi:hypothetical protein
LLHKNDPCHKLHNQWKNGKGIKRIQQETRKEKKERERKKGKAKVQGRTHGVRVRKQAQDGNNKGEH